MRLPGRHVSLGLLCALHKAPLACAAESLAGTAFAFRIVLPFWEMEMKGMLTSAAHCSCVPCVDSAPDFRQRLTCTNWSKIISSFLPELAALCNSPTPSSQPQPCCRGTALAEQWGGPGRAAPPWQESGVGLEAPGPG